MAEVTITDVYTTGGGGGRQWVFNPGDPIQFNIDHFASDDVPLGTTYRASWILDRYEQVTANDGDKIGFRFVVRRGFHSDFSYDVGRSFTTWFNTALEQLPDPLNLPLQDRNAFLISSRPTPSSFRFRDIGN